MISLKSKQYSSSRGTSTFHPPYSTAFFIAPNMNIRVDQKGE